MTNNQNQPWNLHERLEKYPGYRGMHVSTFTNRQVVEYNPEVLSAILLTPHMRFDANMMSKKMLQSNLQNFYKIPKLVK